MDGGDFESEEGAEAVGANVMDPGSGGEKHAGLHPVLKDRGPSHPGIQVGELGTGAPDGTYPWGIPPQGVPSSEGVRSMETSRGGWFYPPLEEAMQEVGLETIENYISHRQNTIFQYIATRTILETCLKK